MKEILSILPMGLLNKFRRAIACWLIKRKRTLDFNEPIVSFTFDDVPNSGFEKGREILSKYGYNGTYYVSLGLKDDLDVTKPFFDHNYLKLVVEEGGEIACHTHDHLHFYQTSGANIAPDLEKNQRAMQEIIPGYKFTNFSYPYGEQTIQAKLAIKKYYKSARAVNVGVNAKTCDLLNLLAVPLDVYFDVKRVKEQIDIAIASKGWAILYTHDLEEKHSEWGFSPVNFEEIVKYVSEKKIKVLTVEQVLQKVK